jgi:hypothetical protein
MPFSLNPESELDFDRAVPFDFCRLLPVSRLNPDAGGLFRGNATPAIQDKDTMSDLSTPRAARPARFFESAITSNDADPTEKLGQRLETRLAGGKIPPSGDFYRLRKR